MWLVNRLLIAVCTCSLIGLLCAQGMPKMNSVEPATGKPGVELTVSGENLGKNAVAEIYLTNGKDDIKLSIVQQAATAIKCRVPNSTKTGRFSLMLLTAGADPKLIEQPIKVTIE